MSMFGLATMYKNQPKKWIMRQLKSAPHCQKKKKHHKKNVISNNWTCYPCYLNFAKRKICSKESTSSVSGIVLMMENEYCCICFRIRLWMNAFPRFSIVSLRFAYSLATHTSEMVCSIQKIVCLTHRIPHHRTSAAPWIQPRNTDCISIWLSTLSNTIAPLHQRSQIRIRPTTPLSKHTAERKNSWYAHSLENSSVSSWWKLFGETKHNHCLRFRKSSSSKCENNGRKRK